MAIKKTVELEVNTNLEPTINNLRELKRQLKDTAAGSADFNRLSASIRGMEDSISDAKSTGDDFFGQLENAPGILGSLGQGIRGAERTFSSFNGALKASVIGIFAGLLAGLVAAFRNNEGAMKKLQPVLDLIDKTFQGVYRAVEPLFDIFLDLAMRALPAVQRGIGIVYSSMVAYFTFLKEAGGGVINILKGVFTLDADTISQGIEQIGGSFKKTQESYGESLKRFNAGSKEFTAKEKEELEEREKNEKEAADKRKAAQEKSAQQRREAQEKARLAAKQHAQDLKDIEQGLINDIADLEAKTDEQKLQLRKDRELKKIQEKIKAGDDEEKLMKLFNQKYAKLEMELSLNSSIAGRLSVKDAQERTKILGIENDKILDYKDAKNEEEIAKVKEHNEKLLNEQKEKDLKNLDFLYLGYEDEKRLLEQKNADKLAINKKYNDQITNDNQEAAEKQAAIDQAVFDLKLQLANQIGVALGALGGLFKKNTAAAKIAGLAEIAIGTATGLINGLDIAQKTAKAAGPGAAFAFPLFYATQVAAVIGAASRAKAVLAGGEGGGGGGSTSTPSPAPSVGAPAVNVVGTSPTQILSQQISNQRQEPIKAYVVASDVTTQQSLDRNIVQSSSIG